MEDIRTVSAQSLPSQLTPNELQTVRHSSYLWGISFLVFDGAFYLAAVFGAVTSTVWWVSLLCVVVAGFSTSGLLIIAHDACHQSLTPHRRLNRMIGTIAFLPALHAYSLWRHGHNFMHHLHTNLRGKDYVWEPVSPKEFQQLSSWSRLRYRFFRTFLGHYFYYTSEIWWKRRFFPRKKYLGKIKSEYWFDFSFVLCWILGFSCILGMLRCWSLDIPLFSVSEWPAAIALGLLLPFLIGGMLMSNAEFMHHTHPSIHWYRSLSADGWRAHQARVSIHVSYPQPLDWLLHWIMDHTAHHLQPSIPLYHLLNAQELIEERTEEVLSYQFSYHALWEILRKCKLYDDEAGYWTDYEGNPTSSDSQN